MCGVVSLASLSSFSQNGNSGSNVWKLNGNNAQTTDFIGTTNNQDLIFKCGNIEGMRIQSNAETRFMGSVLLDNLKIVNEPPKERFLQIDNNGRITSITQSGLLDAFDQLACLATNDGLIHSRWTQLPNANYGILYTGAGNCANTRVGIGTNSPQVQLDVRGSTNITGQLTVQNRVKVGTNSLWLAGNNSAGLTNEIFTTNGPLTINGTGITPGQTGENTYINPTNGMVGIGTNIPEDKLQVGSNTSKLVIGSAYSAELGFGTSYVGFNASKSGDVWKTAGDGAHDGGAVIYGDVFGSIIFSTLPYIGATGQTGIADTTVKNNTRLFIHRDGNVGIGTQRVTGYKLSVEGFIRAREIEVNPDVWYDFVFNEDYQLKTLTEVETYIAKNKHLPNVPSEKEVLANGIKLGEMNAVLLQKVEELTLYMIAMDKRMKQLENENQSR